MTMELQEHVLGELFGGGAIVKEVEGDAEHHRLMTVDERLEIEGYLGLERGGQGGPHPSRDIYEKDGAPGCRLNEEGRGQRAYFASAEACVLVSGPMPEICSRAGSSFAPS